MGYMTPGLTDNKKYVDSDKIAFVGDFAAPLAADVEAVLHAVRVFRDSLGSTPTIMNLESAVRRSSHMPETRALGVHSVSDLVAKALRQLNTCVVSVANNHVYDAGHDEFSRLVKFLNLGTGVAVAGSACRDSSIARVVLPTGKSVSVIAAAWNGTGAKGSGVSRFWFPGALRRKIAIEHLKSDFVALLVHWGYEFEKFPMPIQRQWAHDFIDSGADLVIGTHPHVIQGIESYEGKIIVYSLGNFIFPRTTVTAYHPVSVGVGMALGVEFQKDGTYNYEIIGIRGTDLTTPLELINIDDIVKELSDPLSMSIEKYRKWYKANRTKWYLPSFDGSATDIFRVVGWVAVNLGVKISLRLGFKDLIRTLVRKLR